MEKIKNILLTLLIISALTSCSERSTNYPSLTVGAEFATNTKDEFFIAYTSNFTGKLESHKDSRLTGSKIQYGGAELQAKYIQLLRKKIPNLLLIDGGQLINDEKENLASTIEHISNLNYDAVLLSDHDLVSLKKITDTKSIPFVNSNLIALDNNDSLTLHGNREYIIKELNGIRIGIIGLTPYKSKLKNEDGLEGILFDDVVLDRPLEGRDIGPLFFCNGNVK